MFALIYSVCMYYVVENITQCTSSGVKKNVGTKLFHIIVLVHKENEAHKAAFEKEYRQSLKRTDRQHRRELCPFSWDSAGGKPFKGVLSGVESA